MLVVMMIDDDGDDHGRQDDGSDVRDGGNCQLGRWWWPKIHVDVMMMVMMMMNE